MHVAGVTLDLNWFVQFVFTLFIIAVGLLHLVKNTASKYFEVDANFEGGTAGAETVGRNSMPGIPMDNPVCAVCGKSGSKKCSRCKAVRYCSTECQGVHWKSGHKTSCKVVKNIAQNSSDDYGSKNSGGGDNSFTGIALIPARGSGIPKSIKKAKEILFPYDEFVKLFNWNKPGFRPCGLINCGNSCFANVVLQCLGSTRPLVAYLLDEGHRRECVRDDWCFLCEFQSHLERASQSSQAFSPMNIISRLPNIGGNLGYGRQEDAHEFMRLSIDTMQSVCLDVFGGEKAVPSKSQETTIIQHIFGGHLQSQVICTVCNNVSNQYENMMDLTVEIHGEASSLEECLDQFTVKECLHGENMYKCDGCNDYVKAWKRLTVKRAPNILTIALKRFQSGRFGKLNKRIAFPETLDLSPYMSEAGNDPDIYKLYAVVVHIDMLNASFFGHYICYTKDFRGNWYRIDDCKVINVELEEVLSQGAYMLFYSRVQAQPACLKAPDPSKEQEMVNGEVEPCPNGKVEISTPNNCVEAVFSSGSVLYDGTGLFPGSHERETLAEDSLEAVKENVKDTDVATSISVFSTPREVSCFDRAVRTEQEVDINVNGFESGPSASNGSDEVYGVGTKLGTLRQDSKDVLEDYSMDVHVEVANKVANNESCQVVSEKISPCDSKELFVSNGEVIKEDSEDAYIADCDSALNIRDVAICGNGHAHTDDIASKVNSDAFPYSREMSQAQIGDSKHGLSIHSTNFIGGYGVGRLETMGKSL